MAADCRSKQFALAGYRLGCTQGSGEVYKGRFSETRHQTHRQQDTNMSELQNKAVTLASQGEDDLSSQASSDRCIPFLKSALDLHFALGGNVEALDALLQAHRSRRQLRVDAAVANVVIELAVASHLSDIDMVQATYNRLDAELDISRHSK